MSIVHQALYARVINPENKEGLAITIFKDGRVFGVDIDLAYEERLRKIVFEGPLSKEWHDFAARFLSPAFAHLQQMLDEKP